jgi:hypothetical protein
MKPRPVRFQWNGEAMLPEPRFATLCDRQFVVGEFYTLIPHEQRSRASHKHFFAVVAEVWSNLPDRLALRFPTSEHLRKWALIRCGYADKKEIVLASDTDAERVGTFMRTLDTYAVITLSGPVITVYTAQSQAESAMGGKLFQEAKRDVLEFLANLIEVERKTLEAEASRNAPHHSSDRTRNPVEENA